MSSLVAEALDLSEIRVAYTEQRCYPPSGLRLAGPYSKIRMGSRDEMKFTYPEVGATRTMDLPAGYRTLQVRTLVGHGPDAMRAATDAVMEWWMHRAIPLRIDASAPCAAPGVDLTVHLGLIGAPCRIVWTEQTERWAGWAYGTLVGHPECGEEAFVLHRDDEDEVWLTVTAFSRPAAWYTRTAGPLVPFLQRAYARRCGRVLSRLLRPPQTA